MTAEGAESVEDPGADEVGRSDVPDSGDGGSLDPWASSLPEASSPRDSQPIDSVGPLLLSGNCSRQHCHAPDTGCLDGNVSHGDCDYWSGGTQARGPEVSGRRPTWTGHTLGTTDLEVVTAHRRARLIAVVGAANAGKTTALATYFLALRKGHRPAAMRFAGSFTLLGWHAVTRSLGFPPSGSRRFPPHTTSSDVRSPALLHLRLATQTGQRQDLLFTDVPGEWFEEWAFDASAVEGAQWIAERADLFVVMSDSDALAGPKRGMACTNYSVLASRVSSVADDRSVVPVRAKADIDVPHKIVERLRRVDRRFFGCEAQPLSVLAERGSCPSLGVLDDVIGLALAPRGLSPQGRQPYGDPFLDFPSPLTVTA